MCYGSENTHVFDSSHNWGHRYWPGVFQCRKCGLTAHGRLGNTKPYACELIVPEKWDGPLDCVTLANMLLVMKVMNE